MNREVLEDTLHCTSQRPCLWLHPGPPARSSLKSRAILLRNYDSFLCAHPYMSISRRKPHWSRKPARSPPPRPHSGILACRAFVSTVRFQLRTVHESSSASVSGRPLCKAASPSRTAKRQNVPLRGSLDPPPTSSKAKVARFLAFPRTNRTCHKKMLELWLGAYGIPLHAGGTICLNSFSDSARKMSSSSMRFKNSGLASIEVV